MSRVHRATARQANDPPSPGFGVAGECRTKSSLHCGYWPLRQHVGRTARVINNTVRLEQGGNHHNALCSGVDNALQIIDIDSANAEDRKSTRLNSSHRCISYAV